MNHTKDCIIYNDNSFNEHCLCADSDQTHYNIIKSHDIIFIQNINSLTVNLYTKAGFNLDIPFTCHTLRSKNSLKSFVNLWIKENLK